MTRKLRLGIILWEADHGDTIYTPITDEKEPHMLRAEVVAAVNKQNLIDLQLQIIFSVEMVQASEESGINVLYKIYQNYER